MSRYERRDHRDSRDRRRSPGPSSSRRSPSPKALPKPRDDKELPEAFGRIPEDVPEDESNVLQRMKKNFGHSPLGAVVKCLEGDRKIKIWTRNFKEVRGICTGYVVAFDKHWNILMTDVDEVFLKPKRAKTPFLFDLKTTEKFTELKKGPRKKKQEAAAVEAEKEGQSSEQENVPPAPKEIQTPTDQEKNSGKEKKKKNKRKKTKNNATTTRRHVKQMFVRGDNIVMCAVLAEDD